MRLFSPRNGRSRAARRCCVLTTLLAFGCAPSRGEETEEAVVVTPPPISVMDAGTQGGLGGTVWSGPPGFGWDGGTPDVIVPAAPLDAGADAATRACDDPQGVYLLVVDLITQGKPGSTCEKGEDNYRFNWPEVVPTAVNNGVVCTTHSRIFSADACSYREEMSCGDGTRWHWQCSLNVGASVIDCRLEQEVWESVCIAQTTISRVACPEGQHDEAGRCVHDCSVGHVWNGSACEDQDECTLGYCTPHGRCENRPGSYGCICDPGYQHQGTQCVLEDPCLARGLLCDENAACTGSSLGDAACVCKDGYRGPGTACDDIDECVDHTCGEHQVCVNEPGSFACNCETDYRWDGTRCAPYNGCTMRGLRCNEAAACVEIDGGFACVCGEGYEGDGGVCEPRVQPAP